MQTSPTKARHRIAAMGIAAAAVMLSTLLSAAPATADPITDLLARLGTGSAGPQSPPTSSNEIAGTLKVIIDAPPANGNAYLTALKYGCLNLDPLPDDKFETSNTAFVHIDRDTYPAGCANSTALTGEMIVIYYPAPQGRANFSVTWDPATGHVTARCLNTPHLRLLKCAVTNDDTITFRLK